MDFVINYEYLTGIHNETVITDLSIAGENFVETFQFQIPYVMRCQGDTETGLNWVDGHIPYNELSTVLSEAVAGFAHLYVYGVSIAYCCPRCWGALSTISKICGALPPANSDIYTVVPNTVTEIPLSAVQQDMRIPFTSG
jgi:hypothetical protein